MASGEAQRSEDNPQKNQNILTTDPKKKALLQYRAKPFS
jgi:hypothetical protein